MLKIGQSAEISKIIKDDSVEKFAKLTGDVNPLHLSDEFAVNSRFGQRVAHGMLGASLISAVLGSKLPGPGTIYLSQSLKFKAPMYIGDTITATVEVAKIREDKPIVTLITTCVNQQGSVVIEGEAVVFLDNINEA